MVFTMTSPFERAFTPEDLEAIEARMTELVKADHGIAREEWKRDDAVEFFKSIGEEYKAEIIASIPADDRADWSLPPGRLYRPLSRPPRSLNGKITGL